MSEPALEIADALVALLNAHEFSLEFTSTRAYLAHRELVASTTLAATVMPFALETELDNRRDDNEVHSIGIAIHQKVVNSAPATIDPLVELTREVHDFCRSKTLADARVIKRRVQAWCDVPALLKKQFLSYLIVDCKLIYTPPEEEVP